MSRMCYLIVYPHIFIWIKNEQDCIFYDSSNGFKFVFKLNEKLRTVCLKLLDVENLYCVKFEEEEYLDYWEWIESVENYSLGKIVWGDREESYHPISLPPKLILDNNANENLLQYLFEITFFVGDAKTYPGVYNNKVFPKIAQMNLDTDKIIGFLENSIGYNLQMIYFVGVEQLPVNQVKLLVGYLSEKDIGVGFLLKEQYLDFYCKNIFGNNMFEYQIYFDKSSRIKLSIDKTRNEKVKKILSVYSETDLKSIDHNLVSDIDAVLPTFNGENYDFVYSQVCYSKEDLDGFSPSKRIVFMRQVLNEAFFGKLQVVSNGFVYGNIGFNDKLGDIDTSINRILEKALDKNNAWRYVRNVKPCENCIYQWLCPSPANYELQLKKVNLCPFGKLC